MLRSSLPQSGGGLRRIGALLAAVALFDACSDTSRIVGSTARAPDAVASAVVAPPAVRWLAPLGTGTADPTTFDDTASPVVEVCAWVGAACAAPPVARFTMAPAGADLALRADAAVGRYEASWNLLSAAFTSRRTYRIRIMEGTSEISAISVDVVRGRWAPTRADGTLAPLVTTSALPIAFHLSRVPEWSVILPATGGTLALGATGSIEFPSGAFPSAQPVSARLGSDPANIEAYTATAALFAAGPRGSSDLKITTGAVRPAAPVTVTLSVPEVFVAGLPAGYQVRLFVETYLAGGEEIHDNFELLASTYDAASQTVRAQLPIEAFTDQREQLGIFEAVVVIGSAPALVTGTDDASEALEDHIGYRLSDPIRTGTNRIRESTTSIVALQAASCPISPDPNFEPPLPPPLFVTSGYNSTVHKGTDYRAPTGTDVSAIQDGEVTGIGFDERPVPRPDLRSGKMVKGWGRYVVVKHSDGTTSLYAHLVKASTDGLRVGDRVTKGEVIATSNNTGGSSGPHLHLEVTKPNGTRINPETCVPPDPPALAGQMRIVLTWGASPSDLDAHLYGPTSTGPQFHVFYQAPGSCTVTPFACLDADFTTGFGPETITIQQQIAGVYRYVVHHFSGSGSIATSGARVDVYVNDALVRTFTPPPGAGIYWNVFELSGGTLTAINTYGQVGITALDTDGSLGVGAVLGPKAATPTSAKRAR